MVKLCVICGNEFNALGKDITCSPDCRRRQDNKRANEWYHKKMADSDYRKKRASDGRNRYKRLGRKG